jgi:hypothetical protein
MARQHFSDETPSHEQAPVPQASDGASGKVKQRRPMGSVGGEIEADSTELLIDKSNNGLRNSIGELPKNEI